MIGEKQRTGNVFLDKGIFETKLYKKEVRLLRDAYLSTVYNSLNNPR